MHLKTDGKIIPFNRWTWKSSREHMLLDQPGWHLWLHLPDENVYLEAFDWCREMFGDDCRLVMWYSLANPSTIGIFARQDQAMLFKLTWQGR
jgi:hypothetical protein